MKSEYEEAKLILITTQTRVQRNGRFTFQTYGTYLKRDHQATHRPALRMNPQHAFRFSLNTMLKYSPLQLQLSVSQSLCTGYNKVADLHGLRDGRFPRRKCLEIRSPLATPFQTLPGPASSLMVLPCYNAVNHLLKAMLFVPRE